jgi:hypothetical protein
LFLRGAIRQVKNDALKQELSQLFAAGLSSDEIGVRYRELTAHARPVAARGAGRVGEQIRFRGVL